MLDTEILELANLCLGGKARLDSSIIQKKIGASKTGLPAHGDRGKGLVVIHYLTPGSIHTGATTCYLGTHNRRERDDHKLTADKDADYAQKEILRRYDSISMNNKKAGATMVFWQDTLHEVPPYEKGGRQVIVSTFKAAEDISTQAMSHILTPRCISWMNVEMRKALGLLDAQDVTSTHQEFTIMPAFSSYTYSSWRQIVWKGRFWINRLMENLAKV